ncbi:O-antigen ligase family protein [Qipengyuania sp.]|uniref:O-antigen ligase family protein n=1 Tax=Qipengyuania sp. TaxID=2004515 RepID=UPI003735E633
MEIIKSIRGFIAPRREAVLGGYSRGDLWQSRLWLFALLYLAGLFAAGAMFAYLGANVLMPMSGILAALALLVVWALPESKNPPLPWIRRLLFGLLIALLFWPDYLAFDLPGLPWITALRMFGVPLAIAFLISLSVSQEFRDSLRERLAVTTWVNRFLIIFSVIAFVSIGLSSDFGQSINKFVVAFLNWFIVFYAAVWVFSQPGNATKLAYIFWFFAVLACLVGLEEWRLQQVPWANRIPSFLAIDDPIIQRILTGKSRAATGIYRLQGKFTTPLGFAEFLAFTTSFVLYFVVYGKGVFVRVAALATIPLVFMTIIRTDSRLGAAGFLVSFLLFLAAWSITRWRQDRGSLFGPALTLAYPIIFATFMVATLVVGRLRAMVWGTKAQSFSSQAREAQIEMGLPMIWSNPLGYGIGQGAETLNYRNLAGVLTIDSYYLSLGLEYGVVGFLIYAAVFFSALLYGLSFLLKAHTQEHLLLIPMMASLTVFVIVKSVFSQQDNHPMVFLTLGALCAICWRIHKEVGNRPS